MEKSEMGRYAAEVTPTVIALAPTQFIVLIYDKINVSRSILLMSASSK